MAVGRVVAIVWRGGGRRWFTRRAALRAEARERIRRACRCDPAELDDHGRTTYPGAACRFHDESDYGKRVIDRLARLIARATR